MGAPKILFLCTGNSCRSQMAEAFCRHLKRDLLEACSAGVEKHGLNTYAVKVMAEIGIDMSGHHSKNVDTFSEVDFQFVVTVCDSAKEKCPFFPAKTRMIHRSFEDPPALAVTAKTEEERLNHYRRVRDEIKAFVETLPQTLAESFYVHLSGPPNEVNLRPASNHDSAAIKELVFSVLAEYGLSPDPESTDQDLDNIAAFYFCKGGYFGVAESGRRLVATLGIAGIDDNSCELRKMYAVPAMRGKGLGKKLLDTALAIARTLGYRRMVLETATPLTQAIGLYRSYGFKPYCAGHLSSRCDQAFELIL